MCNTHQKSTLSNHHILLTNNCEFGFVQAKSFGGKFNALCKL